jgi:hypothetical protein
VGAGDLPPRVTPAASSTGNMREIKALIEIYQSSFMVGQSTLNDEAEDLVAIYGRRIRPLLVQVRTATEERYGEAQSASAALRQNMLWLIGLTKLGIAALAAASAQAIGDVVVLITNRRKPDQHAGAQCHHRGGARRRGGARVCRGGGRGEGGWRARPTTSARRSTPCRPQRTTPRG